MCCHCAAHPSNPSLVRCQRCQVRRLEQAWCDASLSKFLPRCDGEKVLGATPRAIRVRRPSPVIHLPLPQLLIRSLKTTAPPEHHQSSAILFSSIPSPVVRLLEIFLANHLVSDSCRGSSRDPGLKVSHPCLGTSIAEISISDVSHSRLQSVDPRAQCTGLQWSDTSRSV